MLLGNRYNIPTVLGPSNIIYSTTKRSHRVLLALHNAPGGEEGLQRT